MDILIIDDEPLVAKILARLLRPHTVQIIGSSVDALAQIDEKHFDLIFCDLMMPDMTGQKLHARACAKQPQLAERFIFITGGALSDESEAFLSQESVRVLYKPFNRVKLRTLVDSADARKTSL